MTRIHFLPFKEEHLPLWERWIHLPHVKNVWFSEAYESSQEIHQRIHGNGYDYPFIITINELPIGYIQSSDLFAYKMKCKNPEGLFTDEPKNTWCMDLFIAEHDYLNKGYGTQIVKQFIDKLFKEYGASTILIDPAKDNHRAIQCYKKAGFTIDRIAHDGTMNCVIMKIINPSAPN